MEALASVLALLLTYLTVSIAFLVVGWIAKAVMLYIVCKKHNMPRPWLVFIPICTNPYMGYMVNPVSMSLFIVLGPLTLLSTGLPYFSLFIALCLLYMANWVYTCHKIYQNKTLFTVLTVLCPVLFPLFLYKTYLVKPTR